MQPLIKHPWTKISPTQAIKIQKQLLKFVKIVPLKNFCNIKKLAACDVSYNSTENKIKGAVCVFDFPSLNLTEKITLCRKITSQTFPYIPGLLSFREIPILIEIFKKIKNEPDALLMDGQGITHPRGIGLATHIGVIFSKISVGCAKSHLWGKIEKLPPNTRGTFSYIFPSSENSNNENTSGTKTTQQKPIGIVLRTKEGVKPVFVSPGHLIDIDGAKKVVMRCLTKYRLPEPLRIAHHLTQTN